MKWNRKIMALLLAIVMVMTLAVGCSVLGESAEQTESVSSAVVQAPSEPQNLKASVKDGAVTLTWDASPGATGYAVAMYDTAQKRYIDLGTSASPTFTYEVDKDNKQTELKFGVYAYTQSGEHRLYSPSISKVTAEVVAEKLKLNQKELKVQVGKKSTLEAKITPKNNAVGILWESADPEVATVTGDGVVAGIAVGETVITATTTNGTKATCNVSVVEKTKVPDGKLIAITFDDGPSYQYTGKLLDALKEHNAKATFFMVGQNVGGNEALLKRMVAEGHELGNHSWDHADLASISASAMHAEIDNTSQAIYNACGQYPTVFRAPYGSLSDRVLNYLTVPSIYWSVDTRDWETPETNFVKKQILTNAYDGAIILLHDIHKTSVDGFIAALDKLEEEGYTLVTVTELLSRRGTPPQAGVTYYDAA